MTFSAFAMSAANATGSARAFVLSVTACALWILAGPFVHYSDAWNWWANDVTSVVTFLMVFLLQHAQKRDNAAMNLKIDELILVNRVARNALMRADLTMTHEDIEAERARQAERGAT